MALRTVNPWLDRRHDVRPSGYRHSARNPDERSDIRDLVHSLHVAALMRATCWVPPNERDDKALTAAFNLLRGVTVNAHAPTMAKRAVPN
jgi:hypothetical protein